MKQSSNIQEESVTFRMPELTDGRAINALVGRSEPLDLNSVYCYLLLCDHFRRTCIVAEQGSAIVGFISGYLLPEKPETFFVWQVAVDETMRNRSLASRMLQSLLNRQDPVPSFLETTVTPSNQASMALFQAFARSRRAAFSTHHCYPQELFETEEHEEELLVRIGPFGAT